MPKSGRELMAEIKQSIKEITPQETIEKINSNGEVILLDVREREEWNQGHLPGAVFIPRGHLELQIENVIPARDKTLIVYCAAGNRSAFAAKTLEELGYQDVASMRGGFTEWRNLGFPVERERVLTPAQLERYARHLIMPEVGERGQARLLDGKVLLVGAGGLGSPATLYLAAAGVGTLGIVDFDRVDATNLQRQIIHGHSDLGRPKIESAKETILDINPDCQVITYGERLTSENILDIIADYDVIVDGCDNFPTRYLVNDACVMAGKPNVHGSIFRFEGQATVFMPGEGPCYRCLYPEPPPPGEVPSCAEAGVLGVLPGVIGIIQATEAIKLIIGKGQPLIGRMLAYDALAMEFGEFKLRRDRNCPVCGDNPTVKELIDYEAFCSGQVAA